MITDTGFVGQDTADTTSKNSLTPAKEILELISVVILCYKVYRKNTALSLL